MDDYKRLIEIVDSNEVIEGVNLPKVQMHKWLMLGQSEYLCEYGTLSDGHEKLTDAQKYAQALKELYYVSLSVQAAKATAMLAQADLMDAEEALKNATKDSDKLRANAKLLQAKTQLASSLATVEDQSRMVRFYYKKKEQLKHVEDKYPGGLEQAELDNWKAVYEYRMLKDKVPGSAPERVDNIPLPSEVKAELGYMSGRIDAIAPLAVTDPAKRKQIETNFEKKLQVEHAKDTQVQPRRLSLA